MARQSGSRPTVTFLDSKHQRPFAACPNHTSCAWFRRATACPLEWNLKKFTTRIIKGEIWALDGGFCFTKYVLGQTNRWTGHNKWCASIKGEGDNRWNRSYVECFCLKQIKINNCWLYSRCWHLCTTCWLRLSIGQHYYKNTVKSISNPTFNGFIYCPTKVSVRAFTIYRWSFNKSHKILSQPTKKRKFFLK